MSPDPEDATVVWAPDDFARPARRAPWFRLAASLTVLVFALATLLTTVVSLGRYCLTTQGADFRNLGGVTRR